MSFGTIGAGIDIVATAADLVANFASDSDSALSSSSLSFVSASVGGTAISLEDIGFSFSAGAGNAGTFSIATQGVGAFAHLALGESVTVAVTFEVSDGQLTDIGVLEYTVIGSLLAYQVELNVLGTGGLAGGITALAEAAAGVTVMDIAVGGGISLEGAFGSLDFTETPNNSFAALLDIEALNVAIAIASDDSSAEATSTNMSTAIAIAGDGSTAEASANLSSEATATALSMSTAKATSTNTATTFATASDHSDAVAAAVAVSVAHATASEGSVASAQASDNSDSTSTASINSSAETVTIDNSSSTATGVNQSDAFAGSAGSSNASSSAEGESDATAIAFDNSSAQAIAATDADATAVATDSSAAAAASDTSASASATATNLSAAEATATDFSTATASAETASVASAYADVDSVASTNAFQSSSATAFAVDGSTSTATAQDSSISSAVAYLQAIATALSEVSSDALAVAQQNSTAEAEATAMSSASSAAGNGADAKSTADTSSTAISFAAQGNPLVVEFAAISDAAGNSVAMALSIGGELASATADNQSAARAATDDGPIIVNVAGHNAQSHETTGDEVYNFIGGSGYDLELLIAEITGHVMLAKAIIADVAMNAAGGISAGGEPDVSPVDYGPIIQLFFVDPDQQLTTVSVVEPSSVTEGDVLSFVFTREEAGGPLTVSFLRFGDATPGGVDYTGPTQVTFASGELTAGVAFQTLVDLLDEGSESLILYPYLIGTELIGIGQGSMAQGFILDPA